jgi:hypothetical protein
MRSIGLRFYARCWIAAVITRCLKACQTCNCTQTGAAPSHNLICSNVCGWSNRSCFFSRCSWQTTKVGQLMSVLWRHYVVFWYLCMYLRFKFWIIWKIFTSLFERDDSRVHQNAVYTGCPRRNVPEFGRVFRMLKYTDITQNPYVQSWTVTEIMAREVWNFDSCYTLIDYQIHIKAGGNMWFL